jgi:hypothetical protein
MSETVTAFVARPGAIENFVSSRGLGGGEGNALEG